MIQPFNGKHPKISPKAYIIGDPFLSGDLRVMEFASIWPGVSARADVSSITIGSYTNIQDNSVLHCDGDFPLIIGSRVTVGHGAILHGCTIGDLVLAGIGAIILNGAVVPSRVIIGAGSLVPEGKVLEPGKLYMGTPARAVRDLRESEIELLEQSALHYVEYAEKYKR